MRATPLGASPSECRRRDGSYLLRCITGRSGNLNVASRLRVLPYLIHRPSKKTLARSSLIHFYSRVACHPPKSLASRVGQAAAPATHEEFNDVEVPIRNPIVTIPGTTVTLIVSVMAVAEGEPCYEGADFLYQDRRRHSSGASMHCCSPGGAN